MEYWRYHRRISDREVRMLFYMSHDTPELDDTYAMAVWLAEQEEMSIHYTIDNRFRDDYSYHFGIVDCDGMMLENLEGLS